MADFVFKGWIWGILGGLVVIFSIIGMLIANRAKKLNEYEEPKEMIDFSEKPYESIVKTTGDTRDRDDFTYGGIM